MRGGDGKAMYEEFFAGYYGSFDIGGMLSAGTTHAFITPFDVLKVNIQSHFAKGLLDGFLKIYLSEGIHGGLFPLWGRNLPLSMVMCSTFEHLVDFLNRKVIQMRKLRSCTKTQQLGVTCLAGYSAGSGASIVSNLLTMLFLLFYNKRANSLKQDVKGIGFTNLFTRTFLIRIMLVGLVVTLQWFFFDNSKLNGL